MYRYEDTKVIHLEITTKCNARCPMCHRAIYGGKSNPNLPLEELSLSEVQQLVPKELINGLKRIYLCGNYGDPIVAKDTLEVFEYFRSLRKDLRLDMFTNGSARDVEWWKRLAAVTTTVRFGIDGLEDTNHLYRKGTQFSSIMRNAKAFISAGGKAAWDFLVFRHNEHQVEQARELSKELGFIQFNVKRTGRFFSDVKYQIEDKQVVNNRAGEPEYYLEMPTNEIYRNTALQDEQKIVDKYGSLEMYLNHTPIQCRVDAEKSLYISAMGHAFPCCWTANQLYLWYSHEWPSSVKALLSKLPEKEESLNALKHGLRNVVNGPFFQDLLLDSWNKNSLAEGRLKCCAKICGTDFKPFAVQFSTNLTPRIS